MTTCKNCEKETSNPKFCSRSCSAIYNNKKRIKKTNCVCPECGEQKEYRSKLCLKCHKLKRINEVLKKPISDYFTYGNHPRFKHNGVRTWAKKLMIFWNIEKKCKSCGYNKHVEVCHKKAISEYSLDTLMEIVNSKENLVYLCRNCHWEFDNDLLEI